METIPPSAEPPAQDGAAAPRRRPRPGERREQILQTLAAMLEAPGAERITTAALAARLQVSEAALYRHFASKAQMFEALMDFIETTLFTRVVQIVGREGDAPDAAVPADGARQAARVVALLLQFGERNPGLARVMVGDALVLEHERLQARMNQLFERIESQLRQCLRRAAEAAGSATPTVDAQVGAGVLTAFALGRLQRFVRTGRQHLPTEHLQESLARML